MSTDGNDHHHNQNGQILPTTINTDAHHHNQNGQILPTTINTDARDEGIVTRLKTNLAFRSRWAEINGAMGDLGTYIPIIMALSLGDKLDLGTTLIFTGIYNIVTGAIYGVPMPVQPMKSISAVALSSSATDFGVPEIMAAGICTSGVVFTLGATGLMRFVYKLIPLPVVRGIQLAQGLSFAQTAVKYIRHEQDLVKRKSLDPRPWLGLDGLVLAIFATCFITFISGTTHDVPPSSSSPADSCCPGTGSAPRRPRRSWRRILSMLPSAVLVFLLGAVLAIVRDPHFTRGFAFGPSAIHVVRISKKAWRDGFVKGAIPQLPLTILNSVVAVCRLTSDLFPERPEATATSVSITVGLMNLVGCWFGAMPCCHGAGGLAGQYKFGGRSGGCVALLGMGKLAVGLLLGGSLLQLFASFPVGLLGVLLLFAGVELAMAGRDMTTKEESFVMLVCTAVSLVGKSAALGFLCGMVAWLLLWARRRLLTREG